MKIQAARARLDEMQDGGATVVNGRAVYRVGDRFRVEGFGGTADLSQASWRVGGESRTGNRVTDIVLKIWGEAVAHGKWAIVNRCRKFYDRRMVRIGMWEA